MEESDDAREGKLIEGATGSGSRVHSSKGRSSRSRKTGRSPGKRNRKETRGIRRGSRTAARSRVGRRTAVALEDFSGVSIEAGLELRESVPSDHEELRKEPMPPFNLSMGGDDDDLVEYVY